MSDKIKKWLQVGGFLIVGFLMVQTCLQKTGKGESALVEKATKGLDEFAAMRAEIETNEKAAPDRIDELARSPDESSALAAAVTPEEAVEPTAPSRPCTQDERLFGDRDCDDAAPEALTAMEGAETGPREPERIREPRPAVETYAPRATSQPAQQQNIVIAEPPVSNEAKGFLAWRGLVASKPNILAGKSTTYPGAVVRAGCRVLAEIEDELRVSRGDEHLLTLAVKGAMPGCKLPPTSGMRLTAYATLNGAESRILAPLKMCSDQSSDRKSVSCKGRVKSITGHDGLEGEIYDVSMWGTVLDAAIAIGSAPTIARLTQAAASAKEVWSAQAAADTAATLQRAANRIGEKVSQTFEGREIRLAAKAYVIVTFEEDVAL